jgi:DNA-directed RNA polymerase beta' subunit
MDGRGGVNDLRLGPMPGSDAKCLTCNLGADSGCPGHYGYIEFQHLVLHPLFLTHIADLLRCVCFNCSHLLIDAPSSPEDDRVNKFKLFLECDLKGRLKMAREFRGSGVVCTNCHTTLKRRYEVDSGTLSVTVKQPDSLPCRVLESNIRDILKSITDEHLRLLHILENPATSLVMRGILVSPPRTRPSVLSGGGAGEQRDPVTRKYIDILYANLALEERRAQKAWANVWISVLGR